MEDGAEMELSNILSGAIILVVVIGIYIAVSYMRNKKMGGGGGCTGNCASCSINHGSPKCPENTDSVQGDKR